MPPLSTNELDQVNIQLLTDWINQEVSEIDNYAAWRVVHFGNGTSPEGAPSEDADRDGVTNEDEWIALTDPNDPSDFLAAAVSRSGGDIEIPIPGRANRGVIVQRSTDLLDWSLWDALGNDGVPRNPATSHSLSAPADGPSEFFRLYIEEK